jgi:hypothetical protein
MSFPQNLQLYADRLTRNGEPYRNTGKLWDKLLLCADKTLGPDIKRDTQRTVVNEKLMQRVHNAVQDKSGPNRGHRDLRSPAESVSKGARKGSGKGKGNSVVNKGKGKGKGPGVPNLNDMDLAEDSLFLPFDDGSYPKRLEIDGVGPHSIGYFAAGAMEMADLLARQITFSKPLAMIVKEASLRSVTTENQDILEENNSPHPCNLAWATSKGVMHEVQVIIFQLGETHLHFRDLEEDTYKVAAELPEHITVRIKQPDLEGTQNDKEKFKNGFPKLATAAVGKQNVHKDSRIRPKTDITHKPYKKEMVEIMEGTINIFRDKLNAVLRRSGADGIVIDSSEHDDDMALLNVPPEANTVEKAFELALAMGKLAYGVTLTKFGLRIRAKVGTETAAKQAMAPEMAKLIGKALFECRKADGLVFHANGVPHSMNDADLVRSLTIPASENEGTKWTCAPFARTSGGQWGRKTLVVKALDVPSKHTFRIDYLGKKYVIHLIQQERKFDVLDKACDRIAKETEKYQRPDEYKEPTPKKKAQPVRRTMEVDEEDREDANVQDAEEGNASEADIDSDCNSVHDNEENAEADEEESAQPAAKPTWLTGRNGLPRPTPVRQNCWTRGRPSFEPSPSPAAKRLDSPARKEQETPQISAFQAKLDAMEAQRKAMIKDNEDFNAKMEARAETQAQESSALLQQLHNLQTLVAANQLEANNRMQVASDTFAAFQAEMLKVTSDAAAQRLDDQTQRTQERLQAKVQFDTLMAAINKPKATEVPASRSPSQRSEKSKDGEDLIDENTAGSTRKALRTASDGSKSNRSPSAQRNSP